MVEAYLFWDNMAFMKQIGLAQEFAAPRRPDFPIGNFLAQSAASCAYCSRAGNFPSFGLPATGRFPDRGIDENQVSRGVRA